ncbi:MAG: aldose epimerase family protein [Paracoccaceae bacterium]
MKAARTRFGTLPDGAPVEAVAIAGGGLSARLLTYGATLNDLRLDGVAHPLVLGAPTLASCLGGMVHAGAVVGRYANRIAGGRFRLDGRAYETDRNFRGRHTLHGGRLGTSRRDWRLDWLDDASATFGVELASGDMGFPGTLRVTARYALSAPATLEIAIEAETDAPTPASFAPHGYFVLDDGDDVRTHRLRIAADRYLPVDDDLIPTGEIAPVAGTPFDFRRRRTVGGHGYDHNFCLADRRRALREVARVESARSGLAMTIETTEPGLQVYDGAHTAGLDGLDGRRHGAHAGLALEPQHWPDAPNRPAFPDATLRPGETYRHRTRYRFGPA